MSGIDGQDHDEITRYDHNKLNFVQSLQNRVEVILVI